MSTEKERMNAKKREVSLKLVDHPEHYVNGSGNLNDSHLCYYEHAGGGRVLICAKYVDRGCAVPGIGVFFEPPIKKQTLDSLKKLSLPDGFRLDDRSVTSKETGWVVFCKDDCRSFSDMYEQIVDPGNLLAEWKALYGALVKWMEEMFKQPAEPFGQECWQSR